MTDGPFWRLTVLYFEKHLEKVGAFDIETCTWGDPNLDYADEAMDTWTEVEEGSRGQTSYGTSWADEPASIYVNGESVVPRMGAAADVYAFARLLVMMAVKYETKLRGQAWTYRGNTVFRDAYEGAVILAKLYYRAYLGCFSSSPARTLVHELFHTWFVVGWYTFIEGELAVTGRTQHCPSGCAQEKMASAWVMRFAREYGAAHVDTDDQTEHPSRIYFPSVDEVIEGESRCANAMTEPNGIEFYGEDGFVNLTWRIERFAQSDSVVKWGVDIHQGSELQSVIDGIEQDFRDWAGRLKDTIAYHEQSLTWSEGLLEYEEDPVARGLTKLEIAWHRWRRDVYQAKYDRLYERKKQRMEEELLAVQMQTSADFSATCWDFTKNTDCRRGTCS